MKYLSTIICLFFLAAFGVNISTANDSLKPDETRKIQSDDSQAIGFGVNYGAMKYGGSALYDFKFNNYSKLRIQYDYNQIHERETSLFRSADTTSRRKLDLKIKRHMATASLIFYPFPPHGWYVGTGLGYSRSVMKYNIENGPNIGASGQGVSALAKIGVQLSRECYLNFNYTPAFYILYQDDFNEDRLPENYGYFIGDASKTDPEQNWKKAKNLSGFVLATGCFF